MKISFYLTKSGRSPVAEFIDGLSEQDQGRFADVYYGIVAYGFECPRVEFKALGRKLWEIKFKAVGGQYRVLYVLLAVDEMIWLHAFKKKTAKTPLQDLAVAMKRMKEVL